MKKIAIFGLLAAGIAIAYYNALANGFVFDDYRLVVGNSQLRSSSSLSSLLFSPASLGDRPLRNISYLVDVRLGGIQPWVFHFSNLLYHWLAACFVFLVALRLTNSSEVENLDSLWRYRPAVFIAVLWALHPVQTDAVTYISGRRDILGGLCLFAGFWAYLRYRAVPTPTFLHYGWLLLSCIAYGLGILSKESVIVLPALCWLYDVYHEGVVTSLRRHWWFYALSLCLGGMLLWYFAGTPIQTAYKQATLFGGTLGAHVATVARMWVHYLSLFVYPHTLLADYSYDAFPVSSSLTESAALVALTIVVGVAGGLALLARTFPLCGYGGVWMVVSILPVSHVIPIKEIMAEHYLYVPLFGFCLIAGVLLDALCATPIGQEQRSGWRPVVGYAVMAAVVVGMISRTVIRNRDWVDEETLWTTTILTAPRCARAHYNLAVAYKNQKRSTDAAREFSAVLAIVPNHVEAILGFGELAFEAGLYGQALSYAGRAQVLAPQNPDVMYLLAWTYLALKNPQDAERLFQLALTQRPQSIGIYRGLEAVAKERGDETAVAQWAEKRRMLEGNRK
jgi:Tfp pilus assembly protein PilF